MNNNHSYIQRMAAWAMALPACVALVLTGCTNEQITDAVEAPQTRTVTFTAVAPEGAGSRALWESEPASSGKLGFAWEPETDNKIDLFWAGATSNRLQKDAALSNHLGAEVTVTGTVPEGPPNQVIALFPANTIQVGDGEMYRTLPTELTQVGAGTAHLRDYMYLNGTLAIGEVTEGAATMQLAHGCDVLRFNVKNGGTSDVRVTKVEMLAASGKTGVHTRAAITSESANNGGALSYSHPENIAIHVQDATDATKGHLLAAKSGETIESLSVYAHCFPTAIEDGQFLFLVTVTDANGENEKTYITKEEFKVSGITTSDTDNTQKMFKAGYYYTFNLDIANTTRFDEDYIITTVDGKTTYTVTSYAGLQAWREAVMNVDGTMIDDDINLTLAKDITMSEVPEGGTNWIPVGGADVNSAYQKYKGKIDGAGHTISGLVINNGNAGGIGFIGWIENSSITNLKLADVSVTGTYSTDMGALVGSASNTDIVGCEVTSGTVTGISPGGLIGNQNRGSITNCTNRATVTSTNQRAGGIVERITKTTISGCENYGTVKLVSEVENSSVGGIVGTTSSVCSISTCENYGTVMLDSEVENSRVGGIVGTTSSGCSISTCENHGSVAINNNKGYAGGIAGYASDISIVGCTNYNSYIDGKYQGYVAGYVDENTRYNSSNNQNEFGNNELPEYGYINQ